MLGIHLDVGEQGEIISGAETRQVRAQVILQRAAGGRSSGLGYVFS